MICVPETPLLNIPEASPVAEPLMKKFEEAGEEYAKKLELSPAVISELEEPMIPKEEYLRRNNGQ